MSINELGDYQHVIYDKLKGLERKFELSYGVSKDTNKLVDLRQNINHIRALLQSLTQNTLTWEDLNSIGITRAQLQKTATEYDTVVRTNISDFSLLSTITITELLDYDDGHANTESFNTMFSIIEYINHNYNSIFTQKVLLSASKTSGIREQFYLQYQNIDHIFKNYLHYLEVGKKGSSQEVLYREHITLIKAIYTFLVGIQNYIEMIKKDDTFQMDDFQALIVSDDKTISIYGLSLYIALEECRTFIDEAVDYLKIQEKDIFNSMQIEQRK